MPIKVLIFTQLGTSDFFTSLTPATAADKLIFLAGLVAWIRHPRQKNRSDPEISSAWLGGCHHTKRPPSLHTGKVRKAFAYRTDRSRRAYYALQLFKAKGRRVSLHVLPAFISMDEDQGDLMAVTDHKILSQTFKGLEHFPQARLTGLIIGRTVVGSTAQVSGQYGTEDGNVNLLVGILFHYTGKNVVHNASDRCLRLGKSPSSRSTYGAMGSPPGLDVKAIHKKAGDGESPKSGIGIGLAFRLLAMRERGKSLRPRLVDQIGRRFGHPPELLDAAFLHHLADPLFAGLGGQPLPDIALVGTRFTGQLLGGQRAALPDSPIQAKLVADQRPGARW